MNKNIIENTNFPNHLGIIMDGNGRWAKKRMLPRNAGHKEGAKAFKRCVQDCIDLGLKYVTFYTLSTENWGRPEEEVSAILKLLEQYLDDIKEMAQQNTKLIFIGDMSPLSDIIRKKIAESEDVSKNNTGLTVTIALNYGGKDEILNAVRNIAFDFKEEKFSISEINEDLFENYLYTKGMPDVDLIIRPSGEKRVSNFLLWQGAYAELVFMDVLWPDFKKKDLIFALNEYAKRNRRFGAL